jgi:threonine dehydrogenase-like Zn-dependent dehydrogenase
MQAIWFDVSIPKVLATQALGRLWSGAYFSGVSPVRLGVVTPLPLGPGQVRVRNLLCGICASDLHIIYSDVDPRVHPAALPGHDRIYLGHEVVSVVEDVGPAVTRLKVGDRVVMQSRFVRTVCAAQGRPPCPACAEGDYAVCESGTANPLTPGVGGGFGEGYTAHEAELWAVPDFLTDEQAALVEPLACSLRAVRRAPPPPQSKVLVIGCGTIGLGIVMALRALHPDVQVYAAARHPQQRALATTNGATLLAGPLLDETARITGATLHKGHFGNRTLTGGFDVVYDSVGQDETVGTALRCTRSRGTTMIAGVHLHPSKLDLTPVVHEEVELKGSFCHGQERWQGDSLSTMDLVSRLLRTGAIDAQPLLTHRFPLAQWREALRTASDKNSGCIKVMFDYRAAPAS